MKSVLKFRKNYAKALVIAILLLLVYDLLTILVPYFHLVRTIDRSDIPSRISSIEFELNSIFECNQHLLPEEFEVNNAWRECFVKKADIVKSHEVAVIYAIKSGIWLSRHPDDNEVRQAAKKSVGTGMANLHDLKYLYDSQTAFSNALSSSIFLNLIGEKRKSGSFFAIHLDSLSLATKSLNSD